MGKYKCKIIKAFLLAPFLLVTIEFNDGRHNSKSLIQINHTLTTPMTESEEERSIKRHEVRRLQYGNSVSARPIFGKVTRRRIQNPHKT